MPNIAIVWDFDGTLSPADSTTKVVEILDPKKNGQEFWSYVKGLKDVKNRPKWEHVLASDAPIWMYALSRIAAKQRIPLNAEFFKEFVVPSISLYPNVLAFLRKLRLEQEHPLFKAVDLRIHFFVISAGLKDLVEEIFPKDLITWTFGCRYVIAVTPETKGQPESIPVFCMDETMKTRSLFEISKGSFEDEERAVNRRVDEEDRWAPFNNIIYIGDGPTDIPALSLVRSQGGLGIAVYNPADSESKVDRRLRDMRMDKRVDLITKADFAENSELFLYLKNRCEQIAYRYNAAKLKQ